MIDTTASLDGLEYLGDDVSVGRDNFDRVVIVKDRSDGTSFCIALDGEVLANLLAYLDTSCLKRS